MGCRSKEREFPLRSATWSNHRAQQRHHLPTESAEAPFSRPDANEPSWLGYPSLAGTPDSGNHRSLIDGGHVVCGLVSTIAETLREPLAILELNSVVRELNERLEHKDVLLREQGHRYANSLQVIASTLLAKSRSVQSEEARRELQNAHHRIMSVAEIQRQLQHSADGDRVDLRSYLSSLCEILAASMIGDDEAVTVQANVDGEAVEAGHAVSIGRIATELIINALKYAFPKGQNGCAVTVTFRQAGPNWRLAVSDNGAGKEKPTSTKSTPGLGTKIVAALARQLDAIVETRRGVNGMSVRITHGMFVRQMSAAES